MRPIWTTAAAICLLSMPAWAQVAHESKKPAIYDSAASGAKQISAALVQARREKKVVLLQFGANWCVWCHRLHELFSADPEIAATLKKNFVVVMIDVDKQHNADIDARYGNPTKNGLPVIVVLDSKGNRLVTQDTGNLEVGDRHDPAKVRAFLAKWSPVRK